MHPHPAASELPPPKVLWTVGHSTRSIEEFLRLLSDHSIELLADVRRFPGSRRFPHFNPEPLAAAARDAGIAYEHFPELGGRREPRPDSPYTVWRNAAFRGYADHMDSAEFGAGLARLLGRSGAQRTAIMCSEAVWWRCHRAMIADVLKVRGTRVLHIMGAGKLVEHPFTAAARESGGLPYGGG